MDESKAPYCPLFWAGLLSAGMGPTTTPASLCLKNRCALWLDLDGRCSFTEATDVPGLWSAEIDDTK